MQRIRFGILGCASIAERILAPTIGASSRLELTAVASRDQSKAEEFARRFGGEAVAGYEELIRRSDVDAVYVPLPTGLHHDWIMKCLRAGKHVLAEKSIAHKRRLVEEICAEARDRRLCVFENFMFKFHSQFEFVFGQLEAGAIGTLQLFRSSFGFPPFAPGNIRYRQNLGGGALLDAGAYTLKAAQWFLGDNLEVRSAILTTPPGYEVDIQGSAHLVNEKGVAAQVAFGFDNYYQCNIELWGSRGKLTMDRAFTAGPGVRPTVVIEEQDTRRQFVQLADDHCTRLLDRFSECIHSGDTSYQLDEILAQTRLLEKVKQDAKG